MHSSSVIQWVLFALFPVTIRAALDCRPEGPVRPRPSSLHASNIFQDAGGNLTKVLNDAISGSIKTGWPVGNLSFSIGLVSYDQPNAAAPIWEYHHLGKENERGTKKLDKNSQYLIGSITKVMSAYILMKSGVNIDAPVTDFLPELASPSSHIHWEDVSLKMLATHLSGAPTNYGFSEHYYLKEIFQQAGFPIIPDTEYPPCGVLALNQACSIPEVLDGMLRSYPQAAPMSQPAYSNIAFTILSSAIERVTGKNFTQLVEDVVARPLRLNNTFTSPGEDEKAVIPPGQSNWGSDYDVNAPAGGLVSTLSDLSVFTHAILSRTIDLTPAEIRGWLKPETFAGNSQTFGGMPWEIWRPENLISHHPRPITIHGKSGSAQSYHAQIHLIDEFGVGLVALTAGASGPLADIVNAALSIFVPAIDLTSRIETEDKYARVFQSEPSDKSTTSAAISAEFVLDSDVLRLTSMTRNGSDILSAITSLWNLVMGDFTAPISQKIRLFPQGITEQTKPKGRDVSREVWRLWPDLLSESKPELPGKDLDRHNCLGWTLGDWVEYGQEPIDRVVFYRDTSGEIIGFEAPFLRSGVLVPAS